MTEAIKIPKADTPERETFNNTMVGTIDQQTGNVRCLTCHNPTNDHDQHPVRIYGINIAPYSLTCNICNTLIIDGAKCGDGSPLNIWEIKTEDKSQECHYCGGNCPNDEDHSCDGYQGDLDNIYPD